MTDITLVLREGLGDVKRKSRFNQLKYSKQDTPNNGSIGHILSESFGEAALNIGNLILLEVKLNNDTGQITYSEKRNIYYSKSNYDWVRNIIN